VTASALSAYQDAFARTLLAPDTGCDDPLISDLTAQPGFAVYRNTVLKGCIDALQANYPAVARLVGDEWFRAAAAVFARESLPSHPTLLDYGAGFVDFLAAFPPAAELPYLADVARLDRLWSLAHVAADAPLLDPALLAALSPEEMARLRLGLHPAARWRWFDEAPIGSIWSRSREGDGTIGELDWRGEGALLTRPHANVRHTPVDRAGITFLDACAHGESIEAAVLAALDVDPGADLSALVHQLLGAGAFSALDSGAREEPSR
jgi:hypothetical protein